MNNYRDLYYKFHTILHEPSAHTARLAILWPILGQLANSEDGQIGALQLLLKRYRERLLELYSFGYEKLQGEDTRRLEFARNCWPSMGLIEPVTGSSGGVCDRTQICPWCYGRRVIRMFDAVKKAILVSKHKLVAIAGMKVGYTSSELSLAELVDYHRLELVTLIAGHKELCEGIFSTLTVEPDKELINKWAFRYRVLALMDRTRPHNFFWAPQEWQHVYDRPQLEDIKPAVQSVCRYPSELMLGPIERTVQILNLTSEKKLHTSSGCFRNKKTDD